ncbi:MAG: DinB family protein [Chloroflexota bacterium]|nr:DinB family protein [Chloroflexota bacterium]
MADTVMLRSLNNLVRVFLHRMVEGLSDEQVRYSAPNIDRRPIAGVVVHAYRGAFMLASVFAGQGRSALPTEPTTAAEVLSFVDRTHAHVDQILAHLPDGALDKLYKMPWGQELNGLEALTGALAHGILHAGNIQGIRAIGGFPTPPES